MKITITSWPDWNLYCPRENRDRQSETMQRLANIYPFALSSQYLLTLTSFWPPSSQYMRWHLVPFPPKAVVVPFTHHMPTFHPYPDNPMYGFLLFIHFCPFSFQLVNLAQATCWPPQHQHRRFFLPPNVHHPHLYWVQRWQCWTHPMLHATSSHLLAALKCLKIQDMRILVCSKTW